MTTTFPVDPTVGVIRIDRGDGTPLAILVNYACHPVVFGPDNLDYSADYPSEMMTICPFRGDASSSRSGTDVR